MANPWCRLWSDMPNDPKWRTIAKASKQSIGNVIAVYVHMMTCASNATERGRTQSFVDEDIAAALDVEEADIAAIRAAMQGRVLDGDYLTGWEKRQPAREDGAAERGKAYRERQKEERERIKADSERNQTQANATKRPDTDSDTDSDTEKNQKQEHAPVPAAAPAQPEEKPAEPKKPRKPVKTPLPDGFALSDAVKAWATAKGHANLQAHFDSFVGKARANGYTYVDWDQALQNAIRDDWAKLGQQQPRASPARPTASRHSGFENIDYSEGIEDGRIT